MSIALADFTLARVNERERAVLARADHISRRDSNAWRCLASTAGRGICGFRLVAEGMPLADAEAIAADHAREHADPLALATFAAHRAVVVRYAAIERDNDVARADAERFRLTQQPPPRRKRQSDPNEAPALRWVVATLASLWAGHPEYDPEWEALAA